MSNFLIYYSIADFIFLTHNKLLCKLFLTKFTNLNPDKYAMYIDWSNNSFQIETEMKSCTKEIILCIINNVYYKSCRKNYDFLHFCSVYVPMFRFVFSKLTLFDPLPWAVAKCALRVSLPNFVKKSSKNSKTFDPSFSFKTNQVLFILKVSSFLGNRIN